MGYTKNHPASFDKAPKAKHHFEKIDWTDAKIRTLRALWSEGHSTAEIGRRLSISKNAVVGKAHRLNLPPRPSPIERNGVKAPAVPRRVRGATLPPLACAPVVSPKPLAVVWRPVSCMWPSGDRPVRFECRDNALANYSYCEKHCRVAFIGSPRYPPAS